MNQQQKMVAEFMLTMQPEQMSQQPRMVDPQLKQLRADLIQEELDEYRVASNVVDIADAIADMLYVVYGAAVAHGIDIEPVFKEVHRANMRKLDGPVRADGKRLKGPNWQPPNIEGEIAKQIGARS